MSVRRDIYAESDSGKRHNRISIGLLVLAFIFTLISAIPTIMAILVPVPFEYLNTPFPVLVAQAHPGDSVPVVISRCSREPLIFDDVVIGYTIVRDLTNADTDVRIILPQIGSSIRANTCEFNAISYQHAIPPSTPPGRYYFQGVARVLGRWRSVDVPWRSQTFEVLKGDG